MIDQKHALKPRFTSQSGTGDDKPGNWKGASPADKNFQFFGVERGNKFVRRFKLFLRDGRIISVPYAHLPVFIYAPEQELKIKTSEIDIAITGRCLNKLEGYLSEEKVLWIKESASGTDNGDSEVFIANIRIDGDLLV